MKLKKLQIKKYKNLIDFTVDFESGKGLSILIMVQEKAMF